MSITDYNKEKTCEVDSVNDSGATISKAQPIICVDGNESTTGNGDIVIDFANISDAQDIACYDNNDNLLDYEIEELDTSNNTAVIWVYNDWTRDDSAQLKVAYGNNSANTDRQNMTATWGNSGQNTIYAHHMEETSSPLTDSTANNHDETSAVGPTSRNASRDFNGGYEFDGSDDEVVLDQMPNTDNITFVAWITPQDVSSGQQVISDDEGSNFDLTHRYRVNPNNPQISATVKNTSDNFPRVLTNDLTAGTTYFLVAEYDGGTGTLELFLDTTSQGTDSPSGSGLKAPNSDIFFSGARGSHYDGFIDEARAYDSAGKGAAWIQAEYDASPKGGQVFFNQLAAEDTAATEKSVTSTHDAAIANLDKSVTLTEDTVTQHRQNGNVTLDGSAVQGAEVHCYNVTQQVNVGHDQTDSNGNYQIDPSNVGDIVSGDKLMIATYYEDGNGNDFGQVKVTVV